MALSFLIDKNGNSSARQEWNEVTARDQSIASRLLRHLIAVDSGGQPSNNFALRSAIRVRPDLYWFSINNNGVFYTYDGHTLAVVMVARAENASDLQQRSLAAEA